MTPSSVIFMKFLLHPVAFHCNVRPMLYTLQVLCKDRSASAISIIKMLILPGKCVASINHGRNSRFSVFAKLRGVAAVSIDEQRRRRLNFRPVNYLPPLAPEYVGLFVGISGKQTCGRRRGGGGERGSLFAQIAFDFRCPNNGKVPGYAAWKT